MAYTDEMDEPTVEVKWYDLPDLAAIPRLVDGDLELTALKVAPGGLATNWVPAIRFEMIDLRGPTNAGIIDLRLGDTPELIFHGGHMGYRVEEPYRGRRFAARAVRMALPIAWEAGMSELWITCAPENIASRRTCEIAGGEFVETRRLASWSAMRADGRSHSCRYRFVRP
jgi:tagatose 1,6-diphosphate aldolase